MKRLLITAVALPALSSCLVQSNIGDRIREGAEVYTGVDVRHPVDGKIYRTADMNSYDDAFVRANEVTYTRRTPWLTEEKYLKNRAKAQQVTPTGKVLTVQVISFENRPEFYRQTVSQLPAGVRAEQAVITEDDRIESYGVISKTNCGPWRKAAAAPFDYFLDPVISGVSTVGGSVGYIIYSPFKWMWNKWVRGEEEK